MTDAHRHDWQSPGQTLNIETVLDDWLGPTLALLTCRGCGQAAFIHLVGWHGRQLAERIFAVRTIPAETHRVYLHNISRDYCDLTRKTAETAALIQAAEPDAWLVSIKLPALVVLATAKTPVTPPVLDWQAVTDDAFDHWQPLLTGE